MLNILALLGAQEGRNLSLAAVLKQKLPDAKLKISGCHNRSEIMNFHVCDFHLFYYRFWMIVVFWNVAGKVKMNKNIKISLF